MKELDFINKIVTLNEYKYYLLYVTKLSDTYIEGYKIDPQKLDYEDDKYFFMKPKNYVRIIFSQLVDRMIIITMMDADNIEQYIISYYNNRQHNIDSSSMWDLPVTAKHWIISIYE